MKTKGFTLIELLTAISILAVVVALVVKVAVDTWRTQYINQNQTNLYIQTRAATDAVTRIVKQASSVVASAVISGINYSTNSDINNSVIILQIPSVNASQEIIASTYDVVVFTHDTDQNKLQKITSPAPASNRQAGTIVLSNNAQSFEATFYNASGETTADFNSIKLIKIKLTGEDVIYGKTNRTSFVSSAGLRNK